MSGCINTVLLFYTLRRKLNRLDMTSLKSTLLVLVSAAVLAGIIATLSNWVWDRQLGHNSLPTKLGAVFVPAALAGTIYWLVAYWMGIAAAREMTDLIVQRLRRRTGKAP